MSRTTSPAVVTGTAGDLINEGMSWGIRRPTATAIVTEMIERVITASSVIDADEQVLAVIRAQAKRLKG